MVIGGYLLAAVLAVLALADPPTAAAPTTTETATPTACAAAAVADYMQNEILDPEEFMGRMAWKALAFREKDGPLRVAYEATHLSADIGATRRLLRLCDATDASPLLPTLPKPPKDAANCEKALEAVPPATPPPVGDRNKACEALDGMIAALHRAMDDIEAGRLDCEDPAATWTMAGNLGMVTEGAALVVGCRTGTVNPSMAMMSPAPRR